jgi:hypothetical protein
MLGMPHADALDLPKAGVVCIQTMDRRQGRLKLFLCAKHLSEPMTG